MKTKRQKHRGFLDRTNPNATPETVLRRVSIYCGILAVFWVMGFIVPYKPNFQPDSPFWILAFLCTAIAAAVSEWQGPPD